MPRECWAIEGQLECILFPNHNAWPPCLETRRRRPELGQLPPGAIAIHETLDAARRPRGPELPAVEARPLDDAQRLEELRDEVHVRVLTALFKSQGILHGDSSRPMIQKRHRIRAAPSHRRNRNCARVCYKHRRQGEWGGAKTIRSSREFRSPQCHCGLFSTTRRCACRLYSTTGRPNRISILRMKAFRQSSARRRPWPRGDILKLRAYSAPRVQAHRGAFSASFLHSTELAIQVRSSHQALETHALSQQHGKKRLGAHRFRRGLV